MIVSNHLAVVDPRERRRAARMYRLAWGRRRQGTGWPVPPGTQTLHAQSPVGLLRVQHVPADGSIVVLVHPDRRYGGHWFVREGIVAALVTAGHHPVWFDQTGYGQGNDGSPFLFENVIAVADTVARLRDAALYVWGVSLGAFAAACAAPHLDRLDGLVLESPYPSFASWFSGRGFSVDRMATGLFARMIRRSMPAIDAPAKLAATSAPVLVVASEADDVTPISMTEHTVRQRMGGTHWVRVPSARHLKIWRDSPPYRNAVLRFVSRAPGENYGSMTDQPSGTVMS